MNTRFAGNFDSDPQADAAGATADFENPLELDSLFVRAREGAAEVHPEDPLIDFLRTRRVRASAVRCRRNARRSSVPLEAFADTGTCETPQILSEPSFLRTLHREKRRADRSHAPLSLMLFRVVAKGTPRTASTEFFARCLQHRKRETDYIGRLADDVFVVLLPESAAEGARHFEERLRRVAHGIDYSSCSATYPEDRLETMLDAHDGLPVSWEAEADGENSGRRAGGYALKRAIDLIAGVVILLFAAPIMIATAIAIVLTSPGPIIFRQHRIGKGGRPFVFYKFRSMRVDAADDIHRRYVEDLIKGRAVSDPSAGDDRLAYKLNRDPRITSVGRWIRKTSIDELPQLWNVLKGDMSLVGPRPPIAYEAENYQSWHLRRVLEVKPGITGLWQVEGRSRVSFDEMVRMDIQYAQNCSLWLDLRILARTVGVVLRCEGAG